MWGKLLLLLTAGPLAFPWARLGALSANDPRVISLILGILVEIMLFDLAWLLLPGPHREV